MLAGHSDRDQSQKREESGRRSSRRITPIERAGIRTALVRGWSTEHSGRFDCQRSALMNRGARGKCVIEYESFLYMRYLRWASPEASLAVAQVRRRRAVVKPRAGRSQADQLRWH